MKPRQILYIALVFNMLLTVSAQEIKSVKTGLRINNLPVLEEVKSPDTTPPQVEFIAPKIYPETRYYSKKQEMDLIGRVSDSSGIDFISVNSELQSTNKSGIFTAHLVLESGDNQIRIISMDEHENLQETDIIINYTPPVITLAEKITSQGKYYGLIVGIDDYRDPNIQNLDNPIKDARELYVTLTSKYHFKEENVWLLENATRAQIIRSLDDLSQLISANDNLLIFYAGHGSWDPDANNGFWLPSDADSDEKTNWFRNSALVDYLKEIDSRHTLLIADACFGGAIFKTRNAFGNRDRAYEKLYALPSRKAMTSGNLTEVPDRSSFTSHLILRLEENQETYLSSEQLFSSFRIAVINNSDAIPMFGEIAKVGDQGGDFIFLKE